MSRYTLVVLSNAVDGQEEAFNDWYSHQHLADVVSLPGFSGAVRLKLHTAVSGDFDRKYLALYDIDADDPDLAVQALTRGSMAGEIKLSPALDTSQISCAVFETCSDRVEAPADKGRG